MNNERCACGGACCGDCRENHLDENGKVSCSSFYLETKNRIIREKNDCHVDCKISRVTNRRLLNNQYKKDQGV